jgi:hypothetical protein
VAGAESSYNPLARNSIGASGLWQILQSAHLDLFARYDWRDPAQNAAMAHSVWHTAGDSWIPWTSGAYLSHLSEARAAVTVLDGSASTIADPCTASGPAAAPYAGNSTGCAVPDPSGTAGCVTAALAWLMTQVTAGFGHIPVSCWSARGGDPYSDHPKGRACDYTFGNHRHLPRTRRHRPRLGPRHLAPHQRHRPARRLRHLARPHLVPHPRHQRLAPLHRRRRLLHVWSHQRPLRPRPRLDLDEHRVAASEDEFAGSAGGAALRRSWPSLGPARPAVPGLQQHLAAQIELVIPGLCHFEHEGAGAGAAIATNVPSNASNGLTNVVAQDHIRSVSHHKGVVPCPSSLRPLASVLEPCGSVA